MNHLLFRSLLALLPAIVVIACSGSSGGSSSPAADAGAGDDAAVTAETGPTGDGAVTPDGGDASSADAGPIDAPDDTWTWIDFPDSKCASGTPTGIGINRHAGATQLLFYFEGGGACYDATSCWGPAPAAANVAGYDSSTFASAKQRLYPILDRALAQNPFKNASMVYVPYCTGDFHAGTAEADLTVSGVTKPTYFWGGHDLDLFLARLVPTFTGITHVWSAGTSAGGFGTFMTYSKIASAFPVRVDILDDSGPPLVAKGATDNSGLMKAWGFVAPAGCSPCTKFSDVLAADRKSQPASRFGFLSYASDTVISKDFGYTLAEYPQVIDGFSTALSSDPNAATYVVTNEQSHVVESDPTLVTQYLPWITQMVTDDPAWADATYAHP